MPERAGSRIAALLTVAGALACLLPLAACDRTPQLVPARPDSLQGAPKDSMVVFMRQAQRFWEAGNGDAAAPLTATVLHADLVHRTPDMWEGRAVALLDSLNVGVEAVSSDCATVVNLFSRSDPHGPSWPYVFWCVGDTLQHQSIAGQGMRLSEVAARGVKGPVPQRGLAVLYGRHGPSGDRPVLLTWAATPSGWDLVQTLGPDSLGGTGTGHFEERGGQIELATKTYRILNGFQECPACPHVQSSRRFRWDGETFRGVEEVIDETPYAAFVRFVRALKAADYVEAMNYVSDRDVLEHAIHLGWSRSRQPWRAAPGTHDRATEMVMFHGQQEAYRVWFESFGRRWVISSVDTTARTVEVP